MADPVEQSVGRWPGRPVQAAVLRVAAVAIPVAAGVGSAVLVSHVVGYPHTGWATLVWWALVLVVSTATVLAVERQARRLLPLATLLRLSMIFPDRAPSRFGVALRAGTVRSLEVRLRELRERGIDDEPSRAAAQVLELVGALAIHDRGTRGHAERVRAYADLLGVELGLSTDERDRLHWAALLHDVGKLAVPGEVLNKPATLDESEWAIMRRHPEEGARLVVPLRAWLGPWADTIEQHHERWDGTGYPKGLRASEISRGARIVGVTDAFEVMTAARPYKRPMDVTAARAELTRGAGGQFDPAAVRAFLIVSVGRQRWVAGPLAWLAGLPFLRGIPGGASGQVAGVAARVLAAGAVFAGAVAPGLTATVAGHQAAAPRVRATPAPAPTTTSTAPDAAGVVVPLPAEVPVVAVGSARPSARPRAVPPSTTTTTSAATTTTMPTTTTTQPIGQPPPPPPPPPPTTPPPPPPPPTTPACLVSSVTHPITGGLADPVVHPVCAALPPPVGGRAVVTG